MLIGVLSLFGTGQSLKPFQVFYPYPRRQRFYHFFGRMARCTSGRDLVALVNDAEGLVTARMCLHEPFDAMTDSALMLIIADLFAGLFINHLVPDRNGAYLGMPRTFCRREPPVMPCCGNRMI